jgi:sec-independent protein translocase protein TatA
MPLRREFVMGEIGFDKLLLILVVVLLLFGARRLPEIGASLGKGIREFKRSVSELGDPPPGSNEDRPPAPRQVERGTSSQLQPTSGAPKRLAD